MTFKLLNMSHHLRISEYALSHGNSGIEVSTDERKSDATREEFKKVALQKIKGGLLTHDGLKGLRDLLDPKKSSIYAHLMNFRRSDLENPELRIIIESAAKQVVEENFDSQEVLEAYALLMEVITLNAARKAEILKDIGVGTADNIAKVLDPNWRPE